MNFEQFQTEDRRLVILKGLEAAVQYRANAHLLRTFAANVGHAVSLDKLVGDIAWLAEQALLRQETAGGVVVATLTPRGLDVARGLAECPGVKRPQPE